MQAIHSEFVTDNKQKVVILNTHTKAHYKICFSRKMKTYEVYEKLVMIM